MQATKAIKVNIAQIKSVTKSDILNLYILDVYSRWKTARDDLWFSSCLKINGSKIFELIKHFKFRLPFKKYAWLWE